jgi:UDP-N-acetylglucosamine 2-epimerase
MSEEKLKVLTVIGTRPEIIRLSLVIAKLNKYCEHILVHTGQNYDYELNEIFFEDLGLKKPNYYLNCAGAKSATTIGNVIINVDNVLANERPDAVLILGDTNSSLAAIPAKRRKIPIFHMEAGNRCFDMRVPEEINRRIVDHISDINLTYSDIAREYLIKEGIRPDMVITTGSPMREVLEYYQDGINSSNVLTRLKLEQGKYFLVSAHREENLDCEDSFNKLVEIIDCLAREFSLPVIVSTHPRTKKRINSSGVEFSENVQLLKPLGFMDYNKLQLMAKAVLSDSGTISEESAILNFPALNIRESHERPEAMEEASVMMVGLNKGRIFQALKILNAQSRGSIRILKEVRAYSVNNVSEKILRIIYSYVDYINRETWKKC